MPIALGRGGAGLHGTLCRPDFEVGPRLLHALLPIPLGVRRNADHVQSEPHLDWTTSLGTQLMIFGTADVVPEAEFLNGIICTLESRIGGTHAAPSFSGEAAHERKMGASRRRRGYPAPTRKTPTVRFPAYGRWKPFALCTADLPWWSDNGRLGREQRSRRTQWFPQSALRD